MTVPSLFSWDALTALATTAVAGLAIVQLGREMRREWLRRRGANNRIGTIAYQLRRQLRSWVGKDPVSTVSTPHDEFDKWIRSTTAAKTYSGHLDRAESRVDELMALRPDAWSCRGPALDRAYLLFFEGARHLNEYQSTREPAGAMESYTWSRLRIDARKELCECIAELEAGVIAPTLLTAERALAAKREAEDPLTRAVDAALSDNGSAVNAD